MGAVIRRATLNAVTAAACAAYPEECCGLLIGAKEGDHWRIDEAVAAANVAPKPRHDRFEVDPALHLRLQRELRGTAQAVIGHYHSHPNGRAIPSAADLEHAEDGGLLWIIVAVSVAETAASAFQMEDGGYKIVPLDVV